MKVIVPAAAGRVLKEKKGKRVTFKNCQTNESKKDENFCLKPVLVSRVYSTLQDVPGFCKDVQV